MIATQFKLISIAELCKHEATVRGRMSALPRRYSNFLLDDAETRYPLLYYALLTHWPELLGSVGADEIFYNRYYWFARLSALQQQEYGPDAGLEQQKYQLIEYADIEVDLQLVEELEKKLCIEMASSEWEIAVAFNHFSISKVTEQFGIQLDETGDFFIHVPPVALSPARVEILRDDIPLGLAIGSEKARSEFIIAPLLAEVRRQLAHRISIFSGVELDVDAEQGLRGLCDFLLCNSPHQLVLKAPIVAVVEAKREDFALGIGQCLAEMVAARLFNQAHATAVRTIYGVVTTGNVWKFLRLVDSTAYLDVKEYHINEIERIVGIILSMFATSA